MPLREFVSSEFRIAWRENKKCITLYSSDQKKLTSSQSLAEGSCFAEDMNVDLATAKLLKAWASMKIPASDQTLVDSMKKTLKSFPTQKALFQVCSNTANDLPTVDKDKCAKVITEQDFTGYAYLDAELQDWPTSAGVTVGL